MTADQEHKLGTRGPVSGGCRVKLRTCPKCRSQNVRWYEIYEQPMYWDQFASGIDPEGCETQAGDIIEVLGKCRACQHQWKPKGVNQVAQLPGWTTE